MKVLEKELIDTIHQPLIQICYLKLTNEPNCSCRICSLLSVPCECVPCTCAVEPADSPCFQSLRYVITQASKLETARGTMARILRASAAITKANRPRGYQDFTRQEMDKIIRKPLSAEDYNKADHVPTNVAASQNSPRLSAWWEGES